MRPVVIAVFLTLVLFSSLYAADQVGDIAPPVLVSATAKSWSTDTSKRDQSITMTLHITDDLAGLKLVYVTYLHVAGYNAERYCVNEVKSGRATDNKVECVVEFPRYTAEGAWQVHTVYLEDRVGNVAKNSYDPQGWTNGDGTVCSKYTSDIPELIRSMEIVIGSATPCREQFVYVPLVAQ